MNTLWAFWSRGLLYIYSRIDAFLLASLPHSSYRGLHTGKRCYFDTSIFFPFFFCKHGELDDRLRNLENAVNRIRVI